MISRRKSFVHVIVNTPTTNIDLADRAVGTTHTFPRWDFEELQRPSVFFTLVISAPFSCSSRAHALDNNWPGNRNWKLAVKDTTAELVIFKPEQTSLSYFIFSFDWVSYSGWRLSFSLVMLQRTMQLKPSDLLLFSTRLFTKHHCIFDQPVRL
jgi:hypothetical protein